VEVKDEDADVIVGLEVIDVVLLLLSEKSVEVDETSPPVGLVYEEVDLAVDADAEEEAVLLKVEVEVTSAALLLMLGFYRLERNQC
jgi:hypothetical protein